MPPENIPLLLEAEEVACATPCPQNTSGRPKMVTSLKTRSGGFQPSGVVRSCYGGSTYRPSPQNTLWMQPKHNSSCVQRDNSAAHLPAIPLYRIGLCHLAWRNLQLFSLLQWAGAPLLIPRSRLSDLWRKRITVQLPLSWYFFLKHFLKWPCSTPQLGEWSKADRHVSLLSGTYQFLAGTQ